LGQSGAGRIGIAIQPCGLDHSPGIKPCRKQALVNAFTLNFSQTGQGGRCHNLCINLFTIKSVAITFGCKPDQVTPGNDDLLSVSQIADQSPGHRHGAGWRGEGV
jgi:hypothetical protein